MPGMPKSGIKKPSKGPQTGIVNKPKGIATAHIGKATNKQNKATNKQNKVMNFLVNPLGLKLDKMTTAKKGAPKTGISKPKPIKASKVSDSKTISPMASGAQSIMSEAYKKAHPEPKWVAGRGQSKPAVKQKK